MSYHYVDKNGEEIKAGYVIKIGDDAPEKVYATRDGFFGNANLGVNASSESYLKSHPGASRQYYSLSNFDCRDIEIISRG